MPRVLHVISGIDAQNGGPTMALLGMVRSQVQAGVDVSVLSTWRYKSGLASVPLFESTGAKLRMVGPAWGPLSWHPSIAREVRAAVKECDVVHVHAIWEEVQHQACAAAATANIPCVVTPHGLLDPYNMGAGRRRVKRLYMALRTRADLRRVSALHAATSMEERHLRRWLPKTAKIIVEPFGIDEHDFSPARRPARGEFRERYSLAADRPMVLFLGRLHEGKGLESLLPAFAEVAEDYDATLCIAGPDSGLGGWCRSEAARLGIVDRVNMPGMLRGIERVSALVDADVFAMPSLHENFGISIAEAMVCGLPVVVSDQVGLADVVAEHHLGSVCLAEPVSVAAGLREWLANPGERHAAGQRAQRYALSAFDWTTIAHRWRCHYREMAASQILINGI